MAALGRRRTVSSRCDQPYFFSVSLMAYLYSGRGNHGGRTRATYCVQWDEKVRVSLGSGPSTMYWSSKESNQWKEDEIDWMTQDMLY
jgi:hypothetical protein